MIKFVEIVLWYVVYLLGEPYNDVTARFKLGKWGIGGNSRYVPPGSTRSGVLRKQNLVFRWVCGGSPIYLPPAASPGAVKRRIRLSASGRNGNVHYNYGRTCLAPL